MPPRKKHPTDACEDIDYGHGTIGDVDRAMGGKAHFVVKTEIGKLPPKAIASIRKQPYINLAFRTREEAEEAIKRKKKEDDAWGRQKYKYEIMTADELRYLEKHGKYGINFSIE